MKDFESIKPKLNQIQRTALIVGLVSLALLVIGAFVSPEQFFQSYLFGYLFWIGIALGSLALVALHHMVGGGWGFVIQRLLESGSRTIPLMAVLFIPFVFGMKELYLWARPEVVAADEVLQKKMFYLNEPFFWVRTVGYFLIWGILFYFLNKWSRQQDESGNPALTQKIRNLSGPTILLYVLTITFASIDWVMSLKPHWFSTIFGFLFVVGQGLLTFAFCIIVVAMLSDYKPLSEVIRTKHFHDLGNLMLAFLMLWAYMAFSQFLIIWSGNLPEEITWYLDRLHGGWQWLALFIVIFHFGVPFVVLLSRKTKRTVNILFKVAIAMVVMRLIDLFWIVTPNFHPEHFTIHWMDIAAPIGIGGVWIAAFIWQLKSRALLPLHDPRLKEVFAEHE